MFLAMSFLSLSDTGLAPPVAATTSRDRGSMVAVDLALRPASASTVTVAFQFDASNVRSCPTFDAIPCRPVRTWSFPSEGPRLYVPGLMVIRMLLSCRAGEPGSVRGHANSSRVGGSTDAPRRGTAPWPSLSSFALPLGATPPGEDAVPVALITTQAGAEEHDAQADEAVGRAGRAGPGQGRGGGGRGSRCRRGRPAADGAGGVGDGPARATERRRRLGVRALWAASGLRGAGAAGPKRVAPQRRGRSGCRRPGRAGSRRAGRGRATSLKPWSGTRSVAIGALSSLGLVSKNIATA